VVDPPREPGPERGRPFGRSPVDAARAAAPPRPPEAREDPPRLPRPRPRFGAPSAL
jgi:hypothetical protein